MTQIGWLYNEEMNTWAPGEITAASGGLPTGGTTGQVLTKESDADGDAGWEDGGSQPNVGERFEVQGEAGVWTPASIPNATWTQVNVTGGVVNDQPAWASFGEGFLDGKVVLDKAAAKCWHVLFAPQFDASTDGDVRGVDLGTQAGALNDNMVVTVTPAGAAATADNEGWSVFVSHLLFQDPADDMVLRLYVYQDSGGALDLVGFGLEVELLA